MISDIFYPIFTLMISILACFVRRKSKIVQRFAYTRSSRHRTGPPGGLKTPPDLHLQSFLALPRPNAAIFFLYYPLMGQALSRYPAKPKFLCKKKICENSKKP